MQTDLRMMMYEWKTIFICKDVLNQMLSYRLNVRTYENNAKIATN